MKLDGGVVIANITPFKNNLEVDWDEMAKRTRDLASVPGIQGFVVNAFAAESPALTTEERQRAVAVHKEHIRPGQAVVAAIFDWAPPATIRRGEEAREAGADAVMVCSPYLSAYNANHSPEYAFHFHKEVAESLDMPILLFQLASGDQLSYPHEALIKMASEIDQVVGVKMAQAADCVRYDRDYYALKSLNKKIICLPSVGSTFFHNLSTGADGILSGLAALAPYECVEMLRLVEKGDLLNAQALHRRLAPLNHAIYGFPYADLHTRYKEVAYMVGAISRPVVRSPQLRMQAAELDRLWRAAQIADLRPIPGADTARPRLVAA
ncbi:dihydrodipicolinate synthase family protein [Mesorhizobium sp. B2-5-13]|uniref:dihydrodipicolinate synthase family protein n=1 Tax=unclassified Mesorhizobium TaxID=325217 RepID=UPI001126B9E1|nr:MULTISPECIES: dihydrodipicolinate synthase family protein [unclassified Mesorhizobium]TPJ88181.1 dihydrodipicolinate synthase family protein [Mesorhizobium sp. B2-5-13]TPK52376.1 dihydrodipicolinate synthase family protein [Mesorhizobium sp. B2-5-5]